MPVFCLRQWQRRSQKSERSVEISDGGAMSAGYSVPAGSSTACTGKWEIGPRMDLFHALEAALGKLPSLEAIKGWQRHGMSMTSRLPTIMRSYRPGRDYRR